MLCVVALHSGTNSWGWIGVDIFFVLSGYLITGILLDARDAGGSGWASYGRPFYMRRLLRIVPLAWTFLALLFVVAPALGLTERVPLAEQLWYWGFLSNGWLGLRSSSAWMAAHFWSLAVEEQFYLVWPWVLLAIPRHRLNSVLRGLLLTAVMARVAVTAMGLPPQVGHVYQDLTITRMDGLVAGSLVALLARDATGLLPRRRGAAMWLVACGILFVLLQWYLPTKKVGYVFRYSAFAGCAASALVLLLSASQSSVSRMLSARWLTWVGTRSYGVYVIHLPVVKWLIGRGLAPALVLTEGLVITLILAALSWVVLERPLLAYKVRWPMPARAVEEHVIAPETVEAPVAERLYAFRDSPNAVVRPGEA